MKIFGVGFSGYISEPIVEKLLERGHELRGLARSNSATDELQMRGVTPVIGSMLDLNVIENECKSADAVFLLSTGGFLTETIGKENMYSNCVDTILNALEGTNKTFMMISGTGFWTGTAKENPNIVLNETIIPNPPSFYNDLYEPYKKTLAAKDRGVRSIVIIPSQVYGRKGGYIGPIARRFECYRKYGCIHAMYPSETMISFVHVDDLADLVLLAFEKAKPGDQYMAVTDNENMFNIARMVSRVVGLGGQLDIVSKERLEELDTWTAPFDYEMVLLASSEKARIELSWKPKGLCVIDELQRLIDEKIDPNGIYPSENRKATFANIKL